MSSSIFSMPDYRCNTWKALESEAQALSDAGFEELYRLVPDRETRFQCSVCDITLDFSKQKIVDSTLELLCELATASKLKEAIHALTSGKTVNLSENKPALHTALRAPDDEALWINGHNIMSDIIETRNKMEAVAESIRHKDWLGYSGEPITDIVNIGMGGSDLGARFCVEALSDFSTENLGFHFISDIDPHAFTNTVKNLTPETTFFIISSKSFSTKETLFNAKQAMQWIGDSKHFQKHFIAITAREQRAHDFGIEHVLPIWDWVGGRYSVCSAMSLITMIAIGPKNFKAFLSGAYDMDQHFQQVPFAENLPVLTALLGIWNNNFLGIHQLLILVYANQLEQFVPYVQQLDMESNGKCFDKNDRLINYSTSPIIWGGHGNRAQHSYYQLLCQGTHRTAIDFVSLKVFDNCMVNAFCREKQHILSKGIDSERKISGRILGNLPLNHFRLKACTPYILGAFISLFEHKSYTQGVVWNLNPFDQPGVESAKAMCVE